MTDQQAQIKKRVASMAQARGKQKVSAQDIHVPQKEKSSFVGAFLVTCILLLAIATVPVMYFKGQQKTVAVVDPAVESAEPVDAPIPEREGRQDRWNDALRSRLADVEGDTKKQQHRLWLLVLAHNENANLNKQMESRHHNVEDRGYITFDENWHFNKLPETMTLTPEQLEKIKSGVK
jgi:hypothetical protein